MNYIDCHNHSTYSFDAKNSVYDMCLAAQQAGLSVFAITDHADVHVFEEFHIGENIKASLEELNQMKSRFFDIKIIAGIELGQPLQAPARATELLSLNGLDFVIGSLHNLQGEEDFYFLDFEKTTNQERKAILERYFQELYDMAANADFDILGHITYPYRYFYQAKLQNPNVEIPYDIFGDMVTEILKTIIQRGKGIEINTSGLRQAIRQTLPNIDIIAQYRKLGGEIISVGSDAHTTDDVAKGIKEGYEIVKQAGFQYVTYYENRKPVMVKL